MASTVGYGQMRRESRFVPRAVVLSLKRLLIMHSGNVSRNDSRSGSGK